ncbi:hypothetical protein FPZ49_04635 [Paenibacillus cremeus]|uniref:Uncharacterized protein n=2 Tax=Paenibacillus cremeus TaxID=2163881 RepID=A0A559KGA0_9BACL|nr:hypothetical protein FPZ49_04635 [Paenibacillus cremeus]
MIIYIVIAACDGPKLWKGTVSLRERLSYGVLMLGAVYLSLDYALDKKWPMLTQLIDTFFTAPARSIVDSLRVPS